MQRSGAAHAAHDFIENEQHAVAVADRADALEVICHRRHRPRRRADHGFGDKGDDLIGPEFEDLVFELLCGARGIIGVAFACLSPAIGVAGIDMVGFDQQRLELRAAPFVAAGRKRAPRVAMVALAARDDVPPLRFALLDEILPRHFQRGLYRFRSATDEIDMVDSRRRGLDQPVGELLSRFRGKKAGMGVSELVELLVQSRDHVGMTVAEAGHRGAAGRIDVGLAVLVEQFDAPAADGDRHFGIGGAMKNMGHDDFLLFLLLFLDLRWVLSAAKCPSRCRSEASAASPLRPAMIAPKTSATAKAGDIAWKKDALSVETITVCCAICASGETSLSVIAMTAMPWATAYSVSSTVKRG